MSTRFAVRVKPGARRTAVGGQWPGKLGPALVVAVTAPAVDGRANDAVRQALSAALDVPERDIMIAVGARSRDKIVEVANPPPDLPARLDQLQNRAATPRA